MGVSERMERESVESPRKKEGGYDWGRKDADELVEVEEEEEEEEEEKPVHLESVWAEGRKSREDVMSGMKDASGDDDVSEASISE